MAWVPVDVDTAWSRVGESGRPLARDREQFGRLYDERAGLYDRVAEGRGEDVQSLLLASLGIGPSIRLPDDAALIVDERVAALHELELAPTTTHVVPSGEDAKTLAVVDRVWSELGIGRDGWIVGFGGGSTTDVAGFVAATHLRGVRWVAVPTTLVGMVDAAIGGKTGINTEDGKNLAGAFHFPQQVLIEPSFLSTLPAEERRAGMSEVVKTGLLAGSAIWELPEAELIRALRRVQERGRSLRPVRARGAARDPQPRPHVRARARGGLRVHAAARRRGRARAARSATSVWTTDRRRRGGARTRAGARRPRAGLGRAPPRQEGQIPARAAGRRRRIRHRGSRGRRQARARRV